MKKITLLVALAITFFYAKAQNFTAIYGFDSVKVTTGIVDPTPVPTASGVTFGSFSAVGTPANPTASTRFSFADFTTGSLNGDSLYSQMTGSIDTSKYYTCTITPVGLNLLSVSKIAFRFGRTSTGVRAYCVRSSADGYTSNLAATIYPANANLTVEAGNVFFLIPDITTSTVGQDGSTVTLSGAGFTNISTSISFRFYAWDAESLTGTFSIDNVSITGSTTSQAGVSENNFEGLTIYPNPSSNGIFTLDLGNLTSKTTFTIYNIIGETILTKEIVSCNKQNIDISNLPTGSYFINITNDKSTTTRKITISK